MLLRLDLAGLVERVEGYEHEQAKPYRVTELGRHRLSRMNSLAQARFAPGVDRALEPPRRPNWWLV